jgi:predicted nucleic acid-binding protein
VVNTIKSDPSNKRVLECAAEQKSDYIVSGDRDLLKLDRFGNVPIVRVNEFVKIAVEYGGPTR